MVNSWVWTSGTDQSEEGVFIWMSTGQPYTYTKWRESEPNNLRGDEHCMVVDWVDKNTPAYWNDGRCRYKLPYVCEDKAETNNVVKIDLNVD